MSELLQISKIRFSHLQPINLGIVGALKELLVDNPVNTHGSTAENSLDVVGVLEDEVVAVEGSQALAPNAARELW
jgi:hypothetical protein